MGRMEGKTVGSCDGYEGSTISEVSLRSQGGESAPPREISSEKPAGIASSEQELSPAVNLDINQWRHGQ